MRGIGVSSVDTAVPFDEAKRGPPERKTWTTREQSLWTTRMMEGLKLSCKTMSCERWIATDEWRKQQRKAGNTRRLSIAELAVPMRA